MNIFCIFIRGLPGAGKTTLAKHIEAVFGAGRLDPDEISFLDLNLKSERLKTVKYKLLLNKCITSINNEKSVIWCQPWRKAENIQLTVDNIITLSKGLVKPIYFLIVEIDIDKQVSWRRSHRKFPSKANFDNYISKYTTCDLEIQYLKINGRLTKEEISILCDKFIRNSTQDSIKQKSV